MLFRSLFLIERKILPAPLLYLSAFFEATRRDYYDRLQGVTERGAWIEWLHYFLNGVARQSEDALGRAERINKLLDSWHKAIADVPLKIGSTLIDHLAANPYLTLKKSAQQLRVAFTTVQRAVKRLAKLGIVTEVRAAERNRVYCEKKILDILEEPANRMPFTVTDKQLREGL